MQSARVRQIRGQTAAARDDAPDHLARCWRAVVRILLGHAGGLIGEAAIEYDPLRNTRATDSCGFILLNPNQKSVERHLSARI